MPAAQRCSGNKDTHPSENEPIMTVVHSPATADGDLPCRDERPPTIERDGVGVRAQSRDLATVLTISGDVDASNAARVSAYARPRGVVPGVPKPVLVACGKHLPHSSNSLSWRTVGRCDADRCGLDEGPEGLAS
jgi:hypothetical protein